MRGAVFACVVILAGHIGVTLADDPPASGKPPVAFPHPLITEILYAVPTGPTGDANADGTRQTNGDEFIELVNPHHQPIQLRGYRIRDAAGLNPSEKGLGKMDFLFPACELAPGQVVVVFNGHEATWKGPVGDQSIPPKSGHDAFAGALVFSMKIASGKSGLANKGDFVLLSGPDARPIHAVVWGDDPTLPKPPKETALIEHAPLASGNSVERRGLSEAFSETKGDRAFTPGLFTGALAPAPSNPPTPTPHPKHDARAPLWPTLSELLVPLPPRADADKDGRHDPVGDQFVELVNPHAQAIELHGVVVEAGQGDTKVMRCELPAITLDPGGVVVVFNAASKPGRMIPGNNPDQPEARTPNPRFAKAYVIEAACAHDVPTPLKADPDEGGWVTLKSASNLVIEAIWWGKAPPADSPVLTADVVEQVVFESAAGSVRKSPASGAFEPHPMQAGVPFSPGRSEFKPTPR
jgi:Lamin Tail Domain